MNQNRHFSTCIDSNEVAGFVSKAGTKTTEPGKCRVQGVGSLDPAERKVRRTFASTDLSGR